MSDLAISVNGLKKSFGAAKVLTGVDFQIEQGQIFALVGANGAGKTTTIKILCTLLKPDYGNTSICGYDVLKQPKKVRECISLTGQFTAVDGILTGRENLEMIAKLRGIKNGKKVTEVLLKRFGLSEAANRKADTYSGGMMRRLDIAMSLVGTLEVIFLDEPTTGLDPEARLEVWKTIKKLADGGTTVLLTTQYLEEAEQLADKVAILHDGQIIANGTLDDLKKMFPPAKVEYVEKQPSLEEIYLAIVGKRRMNR